MNVEVDEREQLKLEVHQTMEALQLLKQGLGAKNNAAVEHCQQLMEVCERSCSYLWVHRQQPIWHREVQ